MAILGIGTDIVDVARFNRWTDFPEERLKKIFSEQELNDCLFNPEKLAVRFAAKEAFYKALSNALIVLGYTETSFSFMFTCNYVSIEYGTWNVPVLTVNWDAFEAKIKQKLPKLKVHLSLSHEKEAAVAFVILEQL